MRLEYYVDQTLPTFAAFIDFKKAFDYVDRDLLFYRLLQYNIDAKVYNSIKSLYTNTVSCVQLNGSCSSWFNVGAGVRQGDPLSPTLFSSFINELILEIKQTGIGVSIGNEKISLLAYDDDIVLLAETEEDLQQLINTLTDWCYKRKLQLNESKSDIVHFRSKRKERTNYNFKLGINELHVVQEYKYLGLLFDEYVTFNDSIKMLVTSAGRAFGDYSC